MRRSGYVALAALVLGLTAALFAGCWALQVGFSRTTTEAEMPASTDTPARGASLATFTPTPSPTSVPPSHTPTASPTWTPTPSNTPLPTVAASPTATNVPAPRATVRPTETSTSRPAPTPTAVILALDLTEEELNGMVQKALGTRDDVPVDDLYVQLEPDLVLVTGRARLGFFTMNVEVAATVVAEDGQAVPEIVEIRAGGRPLRGFLRDQVDAMIDPYLQAWLNTETNIYVEEVEIEEDRIRMIGRYK